MEYRNSEETKKFMENVESYLIKRYGSVNKEWEGILTILADNLDLYTSIKDSIETNGIYDVSTGKKNPLLTTLKDLQASIMKQIQHLGISPYATAKIADKEEEDSNLLANIVGEND